MEKKRKFIIVFTKITRKRKKILEEYRQEI